MAAIAAGILALGFGGFLFTRRRRHADEPIYEESIYDEPMLAPVPAAPEPAPAPAPALFTGRPDTAALPPDHPLTDLPDDVDESRLGRHVQAAYRGPTPDNPSLSLKTRLKRAHFFDQRERMAGTQPAPSSASADAMIGHARAARESHDGESAAFWPHDRREDEQQPIAQS